MREEKKSSGIECEMSERDELIEELCEKEESLSTAIEKKKDEDKKAKDAA